MNYKFAFVFKDINDYMRWPDLEAFEIDPKKHRMKRSEEGYAYVEEDVNREKTDKVLELLKSQGVENVSVVSKALYKDFEQLVSIETILSGADNIEQEAASIPEN